jgi:hypothetical protein
MRNCTAEIGEPVTLEIMTKDAFANLRRKSCVNKESGDWCCLSTTLMLDSTANSNISAEVGCAAAVGLGQAAVGQAGIGPKISIKDMKDGKFIVDVTRQVKTKAKLEILAMLGNSTKSFAEEVELDFVAKDCDDRQCLRKCASDRDRPTCMKKCETRKVGADGNCQCRPNHGLKKAWMKGKAEDGTDCYTNSTRSAKEGCCQICPGGTHNPDASLDPCRPCLDYQTSEEGSDCTSCSIGQVWNRIWPQDANDDLKKAFPKGRYCQTCGRGTYIATDTAMCGNATEQDQCNLCKVCPEGGCCPSGNTVVAKKVCECICVRDPYMCLPSTNMRWEDEKCVLRVSCVQGYWDRP